ncbi:OmpA family protein [Aliishimia ponticola]|uniref:OmpA family protein n=1 Tax=Aliishimia ponticola TaxID=2499833 RepID=A0A4S4NA45_9RHOB|nr:OmpA family protein [Aliishimia ponticola]THH35297.1 OmpA family protein [Aliishimia ponticola]
MTLAKIPATLAFGGILALSACTDPGALNDPDYDKTRQGALLGAGIGAAVGAITAPGSKRGENAIKGAIIGGTAGGIIGNKLDAQEADLRQSINNDNVQIQNTGDRLIVTLPQDILFTTDSFAVRPDLTRDLQAVAGNLQAYPDSTIQIIGHTDSDGDASYNQGLSERRANAVADVLRNAGVPFSRIQTYGRGESQPKASNLTPEGKAQNRRVEIVILPTAS